MALDLAQFQQVLDSAQKADAFKADVKRVLKKVASSLSNLQAAVGEAESLMSDSYIPAEKTRKPRAASAPTELGKGDADFPYGKKKDGPAKSRPGRAKAATDE